MRIAVIKLCGHLAIWKTNKTFRIRTISIIIAKNELP